MQETRRKICINLKENLDDIKLNKRGVPYFFKDRTTEYFGLVHSALFGPEDVGFYEAEKLLGKAILTVSLPKRLETNSTLTFHRNQQRNYRTAGAIRR